MFRLGAHLVAALSLIAAGLPVASLAQQAYPSKPIRTILTISGGGEVNARLLAEKMSESLGVPILIESQSGAGGAVGATSVAHALPDGYTLLYATPASLILRKHLVKAMPYDTLRDFVPIAQVGEPVLALVAAPAFAPNSLAEMIEYAKRNPRKVSYGSSGIGTAHHLSGVLVAQMSGTDMVHIPYKSGPQSVTDLVGGRIQVMYGVMSTFTPMVEVGKMKVLAINGPIRYRAMPQVPTIAEVLPGFDRPPSWIGYFGPAGLPQPIVKRLSDEIIKAATNPKVKAKVEASGTTLDPVPSEQFTAFVKRNVELTAKVMATAGVEPE
jgi:tripartite-type tricarboxylate transporter receptor subunit TctC